MSEVDDLMVDVMMRSDNEAENAVVRLIHLTEAERLNEEEQKRVLKALQRRMVKVKSDSDLYDFIQRLTRIIEGQTDSS